MLHVMNADGSDIHQISSNQSNDMDPSVLAQRTGGLHRWDHAPNNDEMSLYRVNPDGTGLELLYGKHSHQIVNSTEAVQLLQARQLINGRVMSLSPAFLRNIVRWRYRLHRHDELRREHTADIAQHRCVGGPAQEPATVNQVQTDPTPHQRAACSVASIR